MHGRQASKKSEKAEAETFPSTIKNQELYSVHDTLTENANLLGFKGDDEGPIDEKKSQAAGGKAG